LKPNGKLTGEILFYIQTFEIQSSDIGDANTIVYHLYILECPLYINLMCVVGYEECGIYLLCCYPLEHQPTALVLHTRLQVLQIEKCSLVCDDNLYN
jgi:hypothetical protein